MLKSQTQVALVIKNLPTNAGDTRDAGPVPGLGRLPGVGDGCLLQCSCLDNPKGRGDGIGLLDLGLGNTGRRCAKGLPTFCSV